MISRRKFLAGAIAAAVAPSVVPEFGLGHADYQYRPGYRLAAMPLPFGRPISRIMPFNDQLIAICDGRAFMSGGEGWKEILPDFNAPLPKFTWRTYGTTIEADSEDELLKRIGAR